MPDSNSAKKRLRQNIVRRDRNRSIKTEFRSLIRKVLEAVKGGEIGQAEEVFRLTAKKLDKAGARSIIHQNKAARIKSRLQKRIKAAKA